MNASSLATVLLTSHLLRRTENPLTLKEFWTLAETVGDPGRLLGCDAAGVQALTGVATGEAERIAALLGAQDALAEEQEKLAELGIRIVSSFDEDFPRRLVDRLGTAAPAVLHVAGEARLLGDDGFGVVGSRSVGRAAIEAAEEAARAAVGEGLTVVSGVAKGIDQTAMGAALEAGGTVIGLPADAMTRMLKDASIGDAIGRGSLCLATAYTPSAGFTIGAAMGRNKLIYGLSKVTFVVASDEGKGGTWAGATEALERKYSTVAVWMGAAAGPGNPKLERRGAEPVGAVSELIEILRSLEPQSPQEESQLRMIF